MKTGFKALLLTATLLGLSGCSPVHAASENTSIARQQPSAKNLTGEKATAPDYRPVSINSASAEELAQSMNGVGLKKAQSIVSYREEFGPFKTLDQLQEVPGIGAALIERNQGRIKL